MYAIFYFVFRSYRGDHTEVIEIDYDPKTISYEDLLSLFWNNHEYGLTTKIKRQVIFVYDLPYIFDIIHFIYIFENFT